jgi:CHASE2 domain-containing sensor protein
MVFSVIMLVDYVARNNRILHFFEETLLDFNITDLAFSLIKENKPPVTDVVLVNMGDLTRDEMAHQINIINRYKPKVIGINLIFKHLPQPEPYGDSLLAEAIKNSENIVLLSSFVGQKVEKDGYWVWDKLETSLPMFSKYADTGFGPILSDSLPQAEQFVTWREIAKKSKTKSGDFEKPFALKIVEKYNPEAAKKFIERPNAEEIINFYGNLEKYTKLDKENVFDTAFTEETIKDKIVLFGYLGDSYTHTFWDGDKFYTPMNAKQIGRAEPDMYSTLVHANIITMMLTADYIDVVPNYVGILVAILVCYFNIAVFSFVSTHYKWGLWYDPITKTIQLVEMVAIVYAIIVYFFSENNIKVDFTLAIFVILLSGDLTEIFLSVVYNAFRRAQIHFKSAR